MYKVKELDKTAAENAKKRWNSIAKPLGGLGAFEDIITAVAGMQGTHKVDISKRCALIMCADNGVVAEGVTQTGQEVTAVVTENFAKGETSVCAMARHVGADIIPVDVGVARDVEGVINKKISYGTKNMLYERAMTFDEAEKAVEIGVECVRALSEKGYKIIVTGEMGVGNTTTSSAVASVLLGLDAAEVTGRGAGLSGAGLERKIEVIRRSTELHRPDKNNVIDVLSKVGGYDIAALAGAFIGGAVYGVPMVIDGFISCAAALCAYRLCGSSDFMIASHVSKESAAQEILRALGKRAVIDADMCLGEGTGGIMLLAALDTALCVYNEMTTFEDINVESYKELK